MGGPPSSLDGSARRVDELVGRKLGEFVIRDWIGEGGFGAVFRAEQPALQREAVIKVLHGHLASRPEVIQRFLREARLASRLDHPFAAHVYAFGNEPDGRLWIAMELVRGLPMDKLLAAQGPIPLERFVPLFERICEVVQTAHEQGIVHRDIKPANVMVLARAGRLLPKLLDFGIARAVGDGQPQGDRPADDGETGAFTTRMGAIMGSPMYMAPEQWADASSAGKPADIYALGVLTYEALTGRPPFRGATAYAVGVAHAEADVPGLGGEFTAPLDAVIARAMAKRPEERYANAVDFAAALREASGIQSEVAPLPQLAQPLRDVLPVSAPQPLAEAVAALESARNVDQARALLWEVVHVTARWLGLLTLASRAHVSPGPDTDNDESRDLLRALGRGSLSDRDWLRLSRALTRSFVRQREAHPIPELVALLHSSAFADAYKRLEATRRELEQSAGRSEEQRRASYAEGLLALAGVLTEVVPLCEYTLVVTRNGRCEKWRGLRRTPRSVMVRRARPLPEGEPMLIDVEGQVTVKLSPLAQVAAPAPGRAEELFLFDGNAPLGPRLVAMPHGFERHDLGLLDWFRDHLFDVRDGTEAAVTAEKAPYRGLAPFTVEDASLYFGREREVEAFVNRLRVESLLAVVGPSGAGKSSFVQAGVIAALPANHRAIVVRPGSAPLSALEVRLARDDIDATGIATTRSLLGERLRATATARGQTLVLVVDQLEEMFTLCHDQEQRDAFAAALAGAARSVDDPVRVVLTLRDDFLVHAEGLAALRDRLSLALKILTAPAREDLERIVLEPARRAGYEFESPELVAEMVTAVEGRPGALALLSFTAAELWKLRDRQFHQLTRKAHAAIGGVAGALSRHADETVDAMTPDEQRLVREAFRHLVTAEGTRQVLLVDELEQLLGRGARAERVIDRLVSARLLVTSEQATGQQQVEVIHEALLGAWTRLVGWRREDAEGARLRDQLRAAARQWEARNRPRGLLWREDALAEYRIWRTRHPGTLTDVEDAFGRASIALGERGRTVRRVALSAAFALLAGVATLLLALRQGAQDDLRRSYQEQGRRELLAGNTSAALIYLAEALEMGVDTPAVQFMIARAMEPLEAEIATLSGHQGQVASVSFSPDGKRLLSAGTDGTARVWDIASGKELVRLGGHAEGRLNAVFSPSGDEIATGGIDGRVRFFDARSGDLRTASPPEAPITWLVFSPDGHTLASSGQDGAARIWDVASGSRRAHVNVGPGELWSIDFDRQSSRFVTSSPDGTAKIFSLDGSRVVELRGHTDAVWYAVFSPDGTRVATASLDGTARIWDASSGETLHVLRGHEQRVTHIAYSPSGRWLATASTDRTARLWDAGSGEVVATLRGHTAQVNRVRFTPDESAVVTVAGDGTAKLWDVGESVPSATLYHGGFLFDAALGGGHTRVATASSLGTIKLWSLERKPRRARRRYDGFGTVPSVSVSRTGSRVLAVGPDEAIVWTHDPGTVVVFPKQTSLRTGAISPDGAHVALGDSDGTIGIAAARPDAPVQRFAGHAGAVSHLAFSPRGDELASAGEDGVLALWDPETGRQRSRIALGRIERVVFSPDGERLLAYGPLDQPRGWLLAVHPALSTLVQMDLDRAPAVEAAFSPSGEFVAAASTGKSVLVWTRDGKAVATLPHDSEVTSLAWSPISDRLLTGVVDGTATLWRVGDWTRVARLEGHDTWVGAVAFNPAGSVLATASGDGVIRFWDAASRNQLHSVSTGGLPAGLRFAPGGDALMVWGNKQLEVWNVRPSSLEVDKLRRWLGCHVPLALEAGQVIAAASPQPCDGS